MLRNVHVDIIIKRSENWPDCHCYVGYGMGVPEWNVAAGMVPHFSGPGPPKLRLGPSL